MNKNACSWFLFFIFHTPPQVTHASNMFALGLFDYIIFISMIASISIVLPHINSRETAAVAVAAYLAIPLIYFLVSLNERARIKRFDKSQ